jgi:hypothetical protein
MGKTSEFVIRFEGVSVRDANYLAKDLETELKRTGIPISRQREDATSQDFGGTLVMVLGAPAAVAAARALHAWAVRKNATSLRIEDGERKLIAVNIESKDAADLVEAFSKGTVESE